jgi:hypothetical protein
MAEKVLELGQGLELWKVGVEEAREQDVNARAQPKEMFDRLASTIGKDQRLEQLPFMAMVGDHLEIVSGHHRVRAARVAELPEFWALVDVTGLDRDKITAKQLAHNAIEGEDDPELLKRLFESIKDIDARLEAFIDPVTLDIDIPKVQIDDIDMGLKFETVIVMFVPWERQYFEETIAVVEKEIRGTKAEAAWLAEHESFEVWQRLALRIINEYDIRTMSTVLAKIAELARMQLGEEPLDQEWVPFRELIGTAYIPKGAAEVLRHAIAIMEEAGDVTKKNRWQALEYLAADYVAQSPPSQEAPADSNEGDQPGVDGGTEQDSGPADPDVAAHSEAGP